jgi:thioredoxin 1
MITRRSFVSAAGIILAAGLSAPAEAIELKPYDAAAAQALIKSGKPVVLHVYAFWCLQCRAQASHLARIAPDAENGKIAFFTIDYGNQKDVVSALNCPRSTLIGYKDGKEVSRMSWGTAEEDVTKILKSVL